MIHYFLAMASSRQAPGGHMVNMPQTDSDEKPYHSELFNCLTEAEIQHFKEQNYSDTEIANHNQIRKSVLDDSYHRYKFRSLKRDPKQLSVVIIGLEQEGKSKVIALLKQNTAVTSKCRSWSESMENLNIRTIELSSYILSDDHEKETMEEMNNLMYHLKQDNNVHVFLFVVSCAIHRDQHYIRPIKENLRRLFGPTFFRYCVMVLTFADIGLRGKSLDEHFDEMVKEGGTIGELYQIFYPNIVAVDLNESSPYGKRVQRKLVVDRIKSVLCTVKTSYKLDVLMCESDVEQDDDESEVASSISPDNYDKSLDKDATSTDVDKGIVQNRPKKDKTKGNWLLSKILPVSL